MARTANDRILTQALRIAERALEERATAEELQELALLLLELDEAVVLQRQPPPRRWFRRE